MKRPHLSMVALAARPQAVPATRLEPIWLRRWWWWFRHDVDGGSLAMPHHSPAPHYGSRVPVDTAPGPVPAYRAVRTARNSTFSVLSQTMSSVVAQTGKSANLSKNCWRNRIFCTVWTMSTCGTSCVCTTGTSTTKQLGNRRGFASSPRRGSRRP